MRRAPCASSSLWGRATCGWGGWLSTGGTRAMSRKLLCVGFETRSLLRAWGLGVFSYFSSGALGVPKVRATVGKGEGGEWHLFSPARVRGRHTLEWLRPV